MPKSKLGRSTSGRKALLRDLVTDLIIKERIITTEARAKAVRDIADKIITLAKKGDLHSRRQAASFLRLRRSKTIKDGEKIEHNKHVNAVKKVFEEIAPRFTNRNGGYVRVLKFKRRRGDNALMVILELVEK